MRRLLYIIAFALMSNSTIAQGYNGEHFDQDLVRFDAVDENYKYKDMEAVSKYFRELSNELTYPNADTDDTGVEIQNAYLTPYTAYQIYRVLFPLHLDRVQTLKQFLHSPKITSKLCNDMFSSKFMKANDYKILIYVKDINNRDITTVTLNSEVCK